VQGHKKKFGNKEKKELLGSIKDSAKKYKGIVFTGGEPTIRKDILDLVAFAKRSGYKNIQIQTNGRMFAYMDFCKKIVNAGATEFSPALHGHTAELHDYLTGCNGAFIQTVAGIKNLKKLDQLVLTNTVIVKSNYRHLPEIAKLLVWLGADQMQFAFVHALGSAKDNFDRIVPRKSLVAPYVQKALDVAGKAGKMVMVEAMPYCLMRGYENYLAELKMPETKVYDLDMVIKDFAKVRRDEGKLKRAECKKCAYFSVCEGPWREYPEAFGWNEFVPVKKKTKHEKK
jgi:MoaA/NifB/PqqE/SkfB family radical SAM enzyme